MLKVDEVESICSYLCYLSFSVVLLNCQFSLLLLVLCFSCTFFAFYVFSRKVHPHSSHYGSVIQQPFLTNQMPALSAHQPINIGIAHVVWPQPTNKRNRHSHNR